MTILDHKFQKLGAELVDYNKQMDNWAKEAGNADTEDRLQMYVGFYEEAEALAHYVTCQMKMLASISARLDKKLLEDLKRKT